MNVKMFMNRTGLKLKKHSPEIMVVTGVFGMVVAGIMACRATTKVPEKLKEHIEEIEALHDCREATDEENYPEKVYKKELVTTYGRISMEYAKLYGPSIFVAGTSAILIFGSHRILKARNAGLAAAYTALNAGYKEYRRRVRDEFGEEGDRRFLYGVRQEEKEFITVDEKGNEKKKKEIVDIVDDKKSILPSEFAKFFDSASRNWSKDPGYNLSFLRNLQDQMTWKLQNQGHLFLNEVYDALDLPRIPEGQIMGWIYDPDHPMGDNYVDFGLYDVRDERKRAFINGDELNILLDFNIDGPIYELI